MLAMQVAQGVARRYCRLCSWASEEDLRQEAVVAALKAEKTWRPDGGAALSSHLYIAALRAVQHALFKASAPVSTCHRTERLAGLVGVDVALTDGMPSSTVPVDVELHLARWRVQVHGRLNEVLGPDADVAGPVLLDDVAPATAAENAGLPVVAVYGVLQRVRRRIRNDHVLQELWEQRP